MNMKKGEGLAVREALLAIADENGCITPEAVLKVAESKESVLHDAGGFTWDQEESAHKNNIAEARRLISRLRTVVEIENEMIVIPVFVRDPRVDPVAQGYVELERLKNEPDNVMAMLEHEFSQALAHLRRAETIAESVGMRPEVARSVRYIEREKKKIVPKKK